MEDLGDDAYVFGHHFLFVIYNKNKEELKFENTLFGGKTAMASFIMGDSL